MKKFCFSAIVFVMAVILTATVSAEGIWRLDGELGPHPPRNLRFMDDLRISGSGQPTASSLIILKSFLDKKIAQDGKIYIVDLREESHGFANGFPVSFYQPKNLANFFKPRNQIETIEVELLTDMLGRNFDFLPLGNEDKKLLKPINVTVGNVDTERQKATELGLIYLRFPTTDMYFPTPDVVDKFINFVASVNENDWVHFHCQAGHGRTSTFMIMYEILKNPEKSLEDICRDQAAKGGSDLLTRKVDNGDRDYYVEAHNLRADNLEKFYDYAFKIHHGYIDISWSEYIRQNK